MLFQLMLLLLPMVFPCGFFILLLLLPQPTAGLPSCCCSCLVMVQKADCNFPTVADSTASASLASNPAAPAAVVAVLLLQQLLRMLLVYQL